MSQSSYFQSAKWALITDATSGIGLAYTKELAKQNKPVVLVARSETRLKEVSGELNNQYGALTRYIMADLSTREGANKVISECQSVHIDLLINNAGKEELGQFSENNIDEMLSSIALNCSAPFILSHHFAKKMFNNGGGNILFLSSIVAFQGVPLIANYVATKAYDLIFAVTDITVMKEHHEQLERMAHYDVLTNLPNRVLLADRLSQSMVRCQRRNQSLAVACMDLDGFKAVNDLHGHIVGDELIVEVAQRMKEALREGDTLARIGGDEFIAVMVDLENIEDCEPVLKRLLKAAADPVTLGDTVIQISASIGVSLYPQDHVDADLLMRHADQAMYVAKQAGKNRYHFFDTTQDNAIKTQGQSIDDIRSALDRLEFVLHYQPKVNMHTSEVIGAEALIRWQHPVRGLVPPLDFLPAIEGHVISLELGEWVIDTALSQINQWRSMGVELPISVNISAYQLQQRNFSTRLAALLADHPGVNPHYLELEILETSVLSDISQVFDTMSACHDLGVRFALDDFGTGYSSLTHIKRLPAYLIKIDQSFVRDMLEDVDDLAIVESVIGLAKTFKREVIAEGVETIEHGVALLKLGCELAQGYGIARPMTAGDIPEWVSNWKADDSWQAYKG